MEKMLQKIASQLAAVDEASLIQLWDKYHTQVQEFEPTRRWEEAVLVLSLIQAVRWKNQLFNAKWAREQRPAPDQGAKDPGQELVGPVPGPVDKERGKLIRFRPRED